MAGRRGPFRWLTPVERAAIAARFRAGARVADVVVEFGVPRTSAARIRDADALARRRVWHSPHRWSFVEREEVFVGICRGESDSEIARRLGRHRSTIGREIGRCGGRRRYRPLRAERLAEQSARRSKQTKLAGCPRLLAAVEQGLERCWSPQQIAARLRLEHPDDPLMRISHETIYRSLYVQARGELRRQLTAQLRTGRSTRRTRGRVETRGRIPDRVPIAERPPEVDERAVPGHWEGDLVMGGPTSAIATLVERQTRYCQLVALPDGSGAVEVCEALKQSISTLPAQLWRSLHLGSGLRDVRAPALLGPVRRRGLLLRSPKPWQRGSNENTNGLLRQYFPKRMSLAGVGQERLDEVAEKLNGRPRETLGFATPAAKLAELIDGVEAAGTER